MNGFSSDWLALREPADRRARDHGLLLAAAQAWAAAADAAEIIDLGCGTGSTVRALAPWLSSRQRWRLVDHDAGLLARALEGLPAECPAAQVTTCLADLERDLEEIVAVRPPSLITLSAFLDLASASWIERLAHAADRAACPVYAALTYDGRTGCEPFDPLDASVLAAFNDHQRRDKGLGAALGPMAAEATGRLFAAAGFDVRTAPADWAIDACLPQLQRQLLAGWVEAVAQTGQVPATALEGWHRRRLDALAQGRLRLSVGHVDLLAVPRRLRRG